MMNISSFRASAPSALAAWILLAASTFSSGCGGTGKIGQLTTDSVTSDGATSSDGGTAAPVDDGGSALDDAPSSHDSGATSTSPTGWPDAGTDGGASHPDASVDVGPTGAPASMEIYSGDGLLVQEGWPSGDVMKVIVLDGSGAPISGATVTWTVTAGGMALTSDSFSTGPSGTTTTNAKGIARAGLRGEFLAEMDSAVPSTIEARTTAGSVTFHAYTAYVPPRPATPVTPAMYVTTPAGRDLGSATHATVQKGAIVSLVLAQAGTLAGHGIPSVGTRFTAADPTSDDVPPVSCANATVGRRAGGIVFSDSSGQATCDLRVPNTPGTYPLARSSPLRAHDPA